MKILHVTRTFHPALGGMEDAIQNLALRQRASGLDASVLTLDRPAGSDFTAFAAEDEVCGIPVRRIPWRGSSRYPLAPSVIGQLGNADIVHVHAIDSFFDLLALTRPLHRRALVASTHGGFFHTKFMHNAKVIWFNTLTRLSVAAYDGIIASSDSDAALFRSLRPRLLRTIENGVDIDKWAAGGAKTPVRHIICFGRFASHKRIGALFALLRALRAQGKPWTMTVAGSPADVSTETLRSAAADLGDAVRVVIRPNEAELAGLIAEAGYFACASSYEGFGIAAVEALSAGLVPVLSHIPPFVKLLEGIDEKLLFDPKQPAPAAAALVRLDECVSSRWMETRLRLMQVARRYDWADVAAAHTGFYAVAMERRRGAGPALAIDA